MAFECIFSCPRSHQCHGGCASASPGGRQTEPDLATHFILIRRAAAAAHDAPVNIMPVCCRCPVPRSQQGAATPRRSESTGRLVSAAAICDFSSERPWWGFCKSQVAHSSRCPFPRSQQSTATLQRSESTGRPLCSGAAANRRLLTQVAGALARQLRAASAGPLTTSRTL